MCVILVDVFVGKFNLRIIIGGKNPSTITKKRQISMTSYTFLGHFWHKTVLLSKKPKTRGFGWSVDGMRKVGVWGTPRIGLKWPQSNLNTFWQLISFGYISQIGKNINCIISFGYISQIGKNIPISFVLFPLDILHKLARNYDWYASTWLLISFGYISQIGKNINCIFFLWIYFTNWQEYTNIICIISFRYISQIGKKLRLIC